MNAKLINFFEKTFEVTKSKSTIRTEVLAGITTFITVAYILIINPKIISEPYFIMNQAEMGSKILNGVFIATCFGGFIGTILVALYAKLPLVQAPGMGLNAFFAYTVMLSMGYSYSQALVIVFISGLLFIFITGVGLREAIIRAIPDCIKVAITPGIGLFITIIGLKSSGLVVKNDATMVAMLDFSKWSLSQADFTTSMGALLAILGLCLISILHHKRVKGAILISILTVTILGIPFGVTKLGNFSYNLGAQFNDFLDVSLLSLDFKGLFSGPNLLENIFAVTMLVISFSLVNMFDSLGTLLATAKQSGLVDENGEIIRVKQALMSDAISTAVGALVGTSTVTTLVESSSGIAEGGRTGLTAFTSSILFLVAIIFVPVVSIVPSQATAPALIFVGILMMSNIKEVDFNDMTNAFPAFSTIVFMPFTYSIANGIALGLITYCIIKLLTAQFKELKPLTVILAIIFMVRYAFMTLG